MARFRLMQSHYLNIEHEDLNKWEYKETDRTTGRTNRKVYNVPVLFGVDPTDPTLINTPDGDIVVSTKFDRAHPRDYVFLGPPTPDMEPLDEEAEALIKVHQANWVHPIESLPGQGYGDARMAEFMKEIAAITAGNKPSSAIPNTSVSKEEYDALKAQVEKLTAMLATDVKQPGKAPAEKRV